MTKLDIILVQKHFNIIYTTSYIEHMSIRSKTPSPDRSNKHLI